MSTEFDEIYDPLPQWAQGAGSKAAAHADSLTSRLVTRLFNAAGNGWVIDLDRGALRIPATGWRERNLARLKRSLLKLRGERGVAEIERDYQRLRGAYDAIWARGY